MKLYTTPKSYISDVALVTDVDGSRGIVHYEVSTIGAGTVHVQIRDTHGVTVASCTGTAGDVVIPDAVLWQPGKAYLYTARVTFGEDTYHQTFGIRTVEVRGTEVLINETAPRRRWISAWQRCPRPRRWIKAGLRT